MIMIKKAIILVTVLSLFLVILNPVIAQNQQAITVSNSTAQMDFPLTLNFSAQISSNSAITDIRLRYKTSQMRFADVTAEVYVTFNQANTVNAKYSLDMRKVGGLPPGANISYWWVVRTASGASLETEPAQFQVADERYTWRNLTQGKVNIYWYQGNDSFTQTLMSTAQQSLIKLENDTGASPNKTINIYIYASTQDLQGSMIFPQEWTGGVAFTQFDIIAIGIAPDNLAWGRGAMTHELTHVVISQITSNPYSDLPVWLNEGLAMYSEGLLNPQYSSLLKDAIVQNRLISVRSLASPFSSDTNLSLLSYAESFSLIDYMVGQLGPEKMGELLQTFSSGSTYDGALQKVYGFDMDGLNSQWKTWVTELYGR
jgi:hypothetical protein